MFRKLMMFVFLLLFVGLAYSADAVLCDEITLDPMARGYSAMTAAEQAADINTEYRTKWRTCVPGESLLDSIDASNWVAITDAQRQLVLALLGVGCLDPQANARTLMINIFGSGSQTIANMSAISQILISRGVELGLGVVTQGDVEKSCPI